MSKFLFLLIAGAICMGGYCESECPDGVNWCMYMNDNGSPSDLLTQVYPPSKNNPTPSTTPTASLTQTSTPSPAATPTASFTRTPRHTRTATPRRTP